MADCHSIELPRAIIGDVVPRASGTQVTSLDVRGLLNQIANFYPETAPSMDSAARLITHLETLRQEAVLSLSMGDIEGAKRLLKQPAVVEVSHG